MRVLRRLLREERGATLPEVLVGAAVAMLVLWTVLNLQAQALREKHAGDEHYASLHESAAGVEWIIQEARQATEAAMPGPASLRLTLPAETVTYTFYAATGEVVREAPSGARVVARQVSDLAFALENGGRTVRVDARTTLAGGLVYQFISRATLRTRSTS